MEPDDLSDDLAAAQAAVCDVLDSLAAEDWARASPCAEWDVAAVVRHLTVGERVFATSLGGTAYDLAAVDAEVAAVDTADLAAAYAEAAAGLRAAFAAAGTGPFPTGLGPMPLEAVRQLRTIEALVHGWDAATGAGRGLAVDEAVTERAIANSLALLERLPAGRTPFAPSVEVSQDAPAIDRLAALLGRPRAATG